MILGQRGRAKSVLSVSVRDTFSSYNIKRGQCGAGQAWGALRAPGTGQAELPGGWGPWRAPLPTRSRTPSVEETGQSRAWEIGAREPLQWGSGTAERELWCFGQVKGPAARREGSSQRSPYRKPGAQCGGRVGGGGGVPKRRIILGRGPQLAGVLSTRCCPPDHRQGGIRPVMRRFAREGASPEAPPLAERSGYSPRPHNVPYVTRCRFGGQLRVPGTRSRAGSSLRRRSRVVRARYSGIPQGLSALEAGPRPDSESSSTYERYRGLKK